MSAAQGSVAGVRVGCLSSFTRLRCAEIHYPGNSANLVSYYTSPFMKNFNSDSGNFKRISMGEVPTPVPAQPGYVAKKLVASRFITDYAIERKIFNSVGRE